MSFFNDIILKLGLNIDDSIGGHKITIVDSKGVLVEGHKGLLDYGKNKISIKLKKGNIIINGENLSVIELNEEELFVKGNIFNVGKVIDENDKDKK